MALGCRIYEFKVFIGTNNGEEKGNPLQYSFLEDPRDGGA